MISRRSKRLLRSLTTVISGTNVATSELRRSNVISKVHLHMFRKDKSREARDTVMFSLYEITTDMTLLKTVSHRSWNERAMKSLPG